jgi:hypothetical protein
MKINENKQNVRPINQKAEIEAARKCGLIQILTKSLEILKQIGHIRVINYTDSDITINFMEEWIFKFFF